jgi:hypothetical protein
MHCDVNAGSSTLQIIMKITQDLGIFSINGIVNHIRKQHKI